ncbi:MAG: PilZ domain-containing protein, partial [Terriglobales bacterium]
MSTSATLRGVGRTVAGERRASARQNVMDRRLVTVNLDNTDAGLMVDLSEKGMAVQALARIKAGANTFLQFELPDTANSIEARGTVVWVDPGS